jgi:hypothetical protein
MSDLSAYYQKASPAPPSGPWHPDREIMPPAVVMVNDKGEMGLILSEEVFRKLREDGAWPYLKDQE